MDVLPPDLSPHRRCTVTLSVTCSACYSASMSCVPVWPGSSDREPRTKS